MVISIINVILSVNLIFIYNYGALNYNKHSLNESNILMEDNDDLERFAVNKKIPASLRDVTLEALSHYPELINTKIDFQFKSSISGSVMQAQPKVGSLFTKSKKERAYKIKISRFLKLEDEKVPIDELPRDVLLGWIGHELGHIQDYVDRSAFDLLSFGMKYYFSRRFISEAEIRADSYAVTHGLGEKIIATKNFVLNHEKLPVAYKNKIKSLYMSPGEILSMVETDEVEENEE